MYDVIIIGGGPAGSAAGRMAGRLGLRTLLLEKEVFPRYKPCGGAFSRRAMSYLDFDIPSPIREREIFGARLLVQGQTINTHAAEWTAILVTRSVLDTYLLEKAQETGIEIKIGTKVVDYQENQHGVEVRTADKTYQAKFLIVAEGSQGKFKHRIHRKDRPHEFQICVVTEIEENNVMIAQRLKNAIEIHFGVMPSGYGWIFPHKDYYSVGIGGLAKDLPNPKHTLQEFLATNGFQEDEYPFHVHLLPVGGIKRRLVKSRVVLCGDAAGFVDAFTGEGLAYAIRSGQIAAEVIANTIHKNRNPSILKEYESRCHAEFDDNLRYALFLSKIVWRLIKVPVTLPKHSELFDTFLEIPLLQKTYKSYCWYFLPRVVKQMVFRYLKKR